MGPVLQKKVLLLVAVVSVVVFVVVVVVLMVTRWLLPLLPLYCLLTLPLQLQNFKALKVNPKCTVLITCGAAHEGFRLLGFMTLELIFSGTFCSLVQFSVRAPMSLFYAHLPNG